ncbi:LiaF domain-containing protein [Pediococcus parvulus]|uniref:LiaF transmembrane domain-containing protein n=1 Tax=Pediococcus parvulus TaxID=54062 RepID=UPI003D06FCB1
MNTKIKWGHWFWGVFFLACAFVLVASKAGWLTYHIGMWTLFLTLILVAATIKSMAYFSVSGTVFSLAFISILYAKPLGITNLVPWTILGAALLLSIGLSLVLQPLKRKVHPHQHIIVNKTIDSNGQSYSESTTTDYESYVDVNVRMGSAIRYVQSANFQQATINVTMGDAKIYFDQASIVADQANISLNGSMGEIYLYVPKEWHTQIKLSSFITEVAETGEKPTKTGPLVTITGNFNIGDITVHYV